MNFEELAGLLPNGFHDARLKVLTIDYLQRTIKAEISFWMGNGDTYRDATVMILGFELCAMDIPDSTYPFYKGTYLKIDAGAGQPSTSNKEIKLQESDSFLFWIWVDAWNGFIRIGAKKLSLNWL